MELGEGNGKMYMKKEGLKAIFRGGMEFGLKGVEWEWEWEWEWDGWIRGFCPSTRPLFCPFLPGTVFLLLLLFSNYRSVQNSTGRQTDR